MKVWRRFSERIVSRPKLTLGIVLVLVAVTEVVVALSLAEVVMLDYVACWISIMIIFALCKITSGYRFAVCGLPIYTAALLVSLFFAGSNSFLIIDAVIAVLTVAAGLIYRSAKYLKKTHFDVGKYFLPKPIRKVSAVIPNYNYAGYLKERVESIISQTYPIYELVILDDASTDDSVKVVEEIVEDLKVRKPKLKVHFMPSEKNGGNVFKAWERCFRESEGDFVWICEADDSCSKYFLSAAMRAFKEDDKVVLSYTESCTIDEKGEKQIPALRVWVDEFKTGHWDKNFIRSGKKELQEYLCANNTIANVSGVVFKRIDASVEKYLREAQKYRLAGDWYFYAKYLLHGKIAYCSESLNFHRMHDKGVTLTTDKYQQFREIEAVQRSVEKDVGGLSERSRRKVEAYKKVAMDGFGLSKEEMKYVGASLEKILEKSGVKDDVLLSVIVSAYNAEGYLEKCLDSVMKSLPEKSEVIVVDDGSTDATSEIAKEYEKTTSGVVRHFRKKNGGLSSVKNFGLTKARGRYVIFMDADDEIKPNGYGVMLKMALKNNADIVVCDMALIYEDGTVINCPVYHEKPGGLKGFLIDGLMASSNNKMAKKELYDKVGKYPEGKNNEDVAITPVLMTLAKNIQYVPSSFYKYYQREGSIQNSDFNEKRLAIFDTVKMATEEIEKIAPDEAEDIMGIMVSNQLIALLVHVICNIKDANKRNMFIGEFCEKYNDLGVAQNKYIRKYCRELKLDELPKYIAESTPEEIYEYIKRDEMDGGFVDYIGRALGIKALVRKR